MSASAVVVHYEEALYQVYVPLPLRYIEFVVRAKLANGYRIRGTPQMTSRQTVVTVTGQQLNVTIQQR